MKIEDEGHAAMIVDMILELVESANSRNGSFAIYYTTNDMGSSAGFGRRWHLEYCAPGELSKNGARHFAKEQDERAAFMLEDALHNCKRLMIEGSKP